MRRGYAKVIGSKMGRTHKLRVEKVKKKKKNKNKERETNTHKKMVT